VSGLLSESRRISPLTIELPTDPDAVADAGGRRARQARGLVAQVGDRGQHDLRAGQDQLAERGRPRAAVVAFERRPAQRPLDAVELRGQRGLREPEPRGGPGHAAVLGDRAHHLQVAQHEVHVLGVGAGVPARRARAAGHSARAPRSSAA
jgi:hypothetical protein